MIVLNVVLGTLVVAAGAWLLWDALPPAALLGWTAAVGGWLWWKARSYTDIWAWSTLLLGAESFAWPIVLLVQMKSAGGEPTDEQMGAVLSAVVMGLFSSVFWLSFAYGLFKRAWSAASPPDAGDARNPSPPKRVT